MAYDVAKKEFSREPFYYVEMEVKGVKRKFCTVGRVPIGIDAQPVLSSISTSPAQIDLQGGFGLRASASLSFKAFLDYVYYGTATAPINFWPAWRAANPYYRYEKVSIYSGYIPNNVYDSSNFTRRDYIIDTFAQNSTGAAMTLLDPLQLANDDTAKVMDTNSGYLSADLLIGETSMTLSPTGIADDEYSEATLLDDTTHYYVVINKEIVKVTERVAGSDTFTIVRGQQNTTEDDHEADDGVQECKEFKSQTVADIAYYLQTVRAGIDTSYYDKAEMDAISNTYFTNTYSALIIDPDLGVKTLSEELCDSAPHYFYYDERANKVQMVAFKAPPEGGSVMTDSANLMDGTVTVGDDQGARISTVSFYYGLYNPTEDLDDPTNYRGRYVRGDEGSASNYGSRVFKTIKSRWVGKDSKTAAVLAASRWGRRWAEAPRTISFSLDPKDSDLWTGDNQNIKTAAVMSEVSANTFEAATVNYQIVSAKEDFENHRFIYSASEHVYGPAVPADEDIENPEVRILWIGTDTDRLRDDDGNVRTLRDIYDEEYPSDTDADLDVRIVIDAGVVCGSSDHGQYSVLTGDFSFATLAPKLTIFGHIVGKGGDAGYGSVDGRDGGHALYIQTDLRIDNQGVIGGGGGGGAGETVVDEGGTIYTSGGGGAGYFVGKRSTFGYYGEDGMLETGGAGVDDGEYTSADGGDLGADGGSNSFANGGVAGIAVNANGYTVTWINTGTIYGAII